MSNNVFTAKNTFGAGLIQDLAPDNTQATCMTNALNATLKTNNGNELSLQNDMGNAKVELAELPEGYVPVGTCEFGGIIYIASYNPETNKSQIGCFPSPERVIGNEDKDKYINNFLSLSDFVDSDMKITSTKLISQISTTVLHPGDEYKITGSDYADNNDCITYTLGVLDSNSKFIKLSNTINSEYVVYNSPYASELYLQGELKVTDTFNIDYNITINDSGEKEIYPIFEINDNINIYKIKLENVSTYAIPTTPTELINEWEGINIQNSNSPFYRGTSEQIEIFNFILYVKIKGNFYQLMTKQITIDLSKVGTGTSEINRWRYFHNYESIILDFLINAYPKPNQELTNLTLEFSEIYPNISEKSFTLNYSKEQYNKSEYIVIDYGVDYQNSEIIGTLYKDKVYKVIISGKDTNNKYIINEKRTLYTCPVFNEFWDKNMYLMDQGLNTIEEDKGLVQDYSQIPYKDPDFVHCFLRNGKYINPLKITIESQVEILNTESTRYNESLNFTGDLIYDESPTNSVKAIFTTSDSLNAKVKITPKITSEFGDTFFNNIEFTYSVNDLNNVKTNEEIDLTNVSYQYVNTANLEFSSQTVLQYDFVPLITNEDDLKDLGLKIDNNVFGTDYTSFKAIDQDKNGYFNVSTITFENTWRYPNNCIAPTYLSLENNIYSLQADNLQNELEASDDYKTFVPITIGTTKDVINPAVLLNDTINQQFIGPFNSDENYSNFDKITNSNVLLFGVSQLRKNEDIFWRMGSSNDSKYYYTRIWWMLMKDQDGKYVPLNYFGYHRPNSFGETTTQQTIFGEEYQSTGIAQAIVNLFATIYKPNGTTENITKYIPTNAIFNDLITEISPSINVSINEVLFNDMPWKVQFVKNNHTIPISNVNKFQSYLNKVLSNKSYCAFNNQSFLESDLNNIEYQYGLDPTRLCYFDGINYKNIDENLPYRSGEIIKNELNDSTLQFNFGSLKQTNTFTETYDLDNGDYRNSNISAERSEDIVYDHLNNKYNEINIIDINSIEYNFNNVSNINQLTLKVRTYDIFNCICSSDNTINTKYNSDSWKAKFDENQIKNYIKVYITTDQGQQELKFSNWTSDDSTDFMDIEYSLSDIAGSYKHINIKIEFPKVKNKKIYILSRDSFNLNSLIAQARLCGKIVYYTESNLPKATIGKYLTYDNGKVVLSAHAKTSENSKETCLWGTERKFWYFNRELIISPNTSI